MVDSVYRTRSLGVSVEGVPDQYADGIAAKVWEIYIGDKKDRTKHYREFFTNLLRSKRCHHILDVACGTGFDSIMLLEEGFQVTSVDASDRMLKYALKERWNRRKESSFDNWVIEEANWLTLPDDLVKPGEGFDAVACLGNSFAHLPDLTGDMASHKTAITNFHDMLKPGGFLFIDHRNYDHILDSGKTASTSIYYNSKHIKNITTSVLYVDNKAHMVTLDYKMDISTLDDKFDHTDSAHTKRGRLYGQTEDHFRLSYYPHRLAPFTEMLKEVFGSTTSHTIYGDFQPLGKCKDPGYYIHAIQKAG